MAVSCKEDMRLLSACVCWVVVWLWVPAGMGAPTAAVVIHIFSQLPFPAVNLTKHGGVCWWSAVGTRSAMWCQADKNNFAQQGTSGYFFLFPCREMVSGVQCIRFNSFLMCFAKKIWPAIDVESRYNHIQVAFSSSIIKTPRDSNTTFRTLIWTICQNTNIFLEYFLKTGKNYCSVLGYLCLLTSCVLFHGQIFLFLHSTAWDGWG